MSASLTEMVLAIAIAGVIFAGALLPVVESVHAYQEAELNMQRADAQHLAAIRVEQVGTLLWRGDDPPPEHGVLTRATSGRLVVGEWELREVQQVLLQARQSGRLAALVQPVEGFELRYLLGDGDWQKSVDASAADRLIALRYAWADEQGRAYRGMVVPTDRVFAAGSVTLPEPDAGLTTYRRSDYARDVSLTIETWR